MWKWWLHLKPISWSDYEWNNDGSGWVVSVTGPTNPIYSPPVSSSFSSVISEAIWRAWEGEMIIRTFCSLLLPWQVVYESPYVLLIIMERCLRVRPGRRRCHSFPIGLSHRVLIFDFSVLGRSDCSARSGDEALLKNIFY